MSDLMIFGRVLSLAEILTLYGLATVSPPWNIRFTYASQDTVAFHPSRWLTGAESSSTANLSVKNSTEGSFLAAFSSSTTKPGTHVAVAEFREGSWSSPQRFDTMSGDSLKPFLFNCGIHRTLLFSSNSSFDGVRG